MGHCAFYPYTPAWGTKLIHNLEEMYIFPSYLWINNQSSLIFHMNSKVSNYLSTFKNCHREEGDKQGEGKKPPLNEVTQHIKQ